MSFSECCGRQPRAITIDMSDGESLSMLVCDVCEQQQWFKNEQPVDVTEVKVAAATRWNRKRGE